MNKLIILIAEDDSVLRPLYEKKLGQAGYEVVAVPGLAVAPGWEDTVRAWKDCET